MRMYVLHSDWSHCGREHKRMEIRRRCDSRRGAVHRVVDIEPRRQPDMPGRHRRLFVTKAHPTVLRKSIINGTGITIGETMSGYDLGPPPPWAWTPPPEWKCPPATVPAAVGQSPPRSPAATMQEHAIQLAQLAAIAHQNLIASPK